MVKNSVAAQDLLDAFIAQKQINPAGNIVQAIVLFDEYRGKGLNADEKSLAFRFSLQDTQTTLQDDVVDARERWQPDHPSGASFRTWLFTLGHHRAVDCLRKSGREVSITTETP